MNIGEMISTMKLEAAFITGIATRGADGWALMVHRSKAPYLNDTDGNEVTADDSSILGELLENAEGLEDQGILATLQTLDEFGQIQPDLVIYKPKKPTDLRLAWGVGTNNMGWSIVRLPAETLRAAQADMNKLCLGVHGMLMLQSKELVLSDTNGIIRNSVESLKEVMEKNHWIGSASNHMVTSATNYEMSLFGPSKVEMSRESLDRAQIDPVDIGTIADFLVEKFKEPNLDLSPVGDVLGKDLEYYRYETDRGNDMVLMLAKEAILTIEFLG